MSCDQLRDRIESKRKEMYHAYLVEKDYSAALIKSRELDSMLNKFRKLCLKSFILVLGILIF